MTSPEHGTSPEQRLAQETYHTSLALLEVHYEHMRICIVPPELSVDYDFGPDQALVLGVSRFNAHEQGLPVLGISVFTLPYQLAEADPVVVADDLAEIVLRQGEDPQRLRGVRRIELVPPNDDHDEGYNIFSFLDTPSGTGLHEGRFRPRQYFASRIEQHRMGLTDVSLKERERINALLTEFYMRLAELVGHTELAEVFGLRATQEQLDTLFDQSARVVRGRGQRVIPAGIEKLPNFSQGFWLPDQDGQLSDWPRDTAVLPYNQCAATAPEATLGLALAGPVRLDSFVPCMVGTTKPSLRPQHYRISFSERAEDGVRTRTFTVVPHSGGLKIARADGYIPISIADSGVRPDDGRYVSVNEAALLIDLLASQPDVPEPGTAAGPPNYPWTLHQE